MNIILITIDALRADFINYKEENKICPNICKLAKNSLFFNKAFSTGPKTPLSFPAILYSRFSNMQNNNHVPKNVPTVAEVFQKEDFFTIGIEAGNPFLSSFFNYDRGFNIFIDYIFKSRQKLVNMNEKKLWKIKKPHIFESILLYFLNRSPHIEAHNVLYDAVKHIKNNRQKDLFVWLHFMDAHYPFVPKKKLLKLKTYYDYSFLYYWYDLYKQKRLYSNNMINKNINFNIKKDFFNTLKTFYSCCIQYIDFIFGKLLFFLKKYHIYDESIIILTSDHGECLGEYGKIGHPPNELCNDLIHIPLLIKKNHQKSMELIQNSVSHIDLFPSIMKDIGINYPKEFCGKNILFNNIRKPIYSNGIDKNKQIVSCIYNDWKYIWYENSSVEKLYNLEIDPNERTNYALELKNNSKELLNIYDKMKYFMKEFLVWTSYEKYKFI
ncbi:MAG: sulfatase [Candidatus Hodarchaeota archaeon]